jgi:hypothetical protein
METILSKAAKIASGASSNLAELTAITLLLNSPIALSYSAQSLLNNFAPNTTEKKALGLHIHGTSQCKLVEYFIEGDVTFSKFMNSVKDYSDTLIPYILRAINLRLSNTNEIVFKNPFA